MLSILDPCGIFRVQSWDIHEAPPSKAEEMLGLLWPKPTGTVAQGRVDVLCVGPTDWLVQVPDPNAVPVLQALGDAFAGSSYRATDVSSALARMQIEGAHARALLAKGCSLDLHPTAFPPHRLARTRFAGMPVVIRCTQPSSFDCIAPLSYRDYLISWLTDAASEFSRSDT
jgi:sarcosine oxidase subunit gamma